MGVTMLARVRCLAMAAVVAASCLIAGCDFHIGGPDGCTVSGFNMYFIHGRDTEARVDITCDSFPSHVHGIFLIQYYARKSRTWDVLPGGKHVFTNANLPRHLNQKFAYRISATCFPQTRERVHYTIHSVWATGPDDVRGSLPGRGGKQAGRCGRVP